MQARFTYLCSMWRWHKYKSKRRHTGSHLVLGQQLACTRMGGAEFLARIQMWPNRACARDRTVCTWSCASWRPWRAHGDNLIGWCWWVFWRGRETLQTPPSHHHQCCCRCHCRAGHLVYREQTLLEAKEFGRRRGSSAVPCYAVRVCSEPFRGATTANHYATILRPSSRLQTVFHTVLNWASCAPPKPSWNGLLTCTRVYGF